MNEAQRAWVTHMGDETGFWLPIINGSFENKARCDFMRSYSAPKECLEDRLKPYLRGSKRILDVGAGPVSVLGSHLDGSPLNITALDPLAHEYKAEFEKAGYHPLVETRFGVAERLFDYVEGSFDFVYSRNALDHGFDPILSIMNMLAVCKGGGHRPH